MTFYFGIKKEKIPLVGFNEPQEVLIRTENDFAFVFGQGSIWTTKVFEYVSEMYILDEIDCEIYLNIKKAWGI